MKKILTIGGDDIAFECNAVTHLYYKNEFRKDFFGDILKLSKAMQDANDLNKLSYEDLEHVNLDVIGQMAWACAFTADEKTPPYIEWLKANPDFSILDHGIEVAEIVIEGIQPKKK